MASNCFYGLRDCDEKLSREHVISKVILKSAFGDPIKNLTSGELLGGKTLIDHEQVIKNVCVRCNSASSPYDVAAVDLIQALDKFYDPTGQSIPFSDNILRWILKTHLNFIRLIKDREREESYPIPFSLRRALIKMKPLPVEKFRLLTVAWQGAEYFWDPDDPKRIPYFGYRSVRFRQQEISVSDFRIKTFCSLLFLPSDGNFKQFEDRVESTVNEIQRDFGFSLQPIDLSKATKVGTLQLENIVPLHKIMEIIRSDKH